MMTTDKKPLFAPTRLYSVDWHRWGEKAFEKAKRENKPQFCSASVIQHIINGTCEIDTPTYLSLRLAAQGEI